MSEPSENYPLLSAIDSPADLRALPERKLRAVADELRDFLVQTVSTRGGHFAAGLGTVELTIALHYVYDTPRDKLVWDVGHQAYPHKVLTGRRERLHTIKQHGGLAPFPARAESEYDTFGVGHAGTSVSAALGMAIAAARKGETQRAVAIIGDGALSAGLAFEALNHAGSLPVDLLVVLNDNDMSISENVGALSNYLARVISGRLYSHLREGGKRALRHTPHIREFAKRSEEHMKGMMLPGTLFEELGFNYMGPIDGHDLPKLVRALRNLHTLHGPQLLHIVTRKGKGYAPAEADPITWHGPGPFDPVSGTLLKQRASGPSYSAVFGQWLCDAAERDPRVVGITPAMREGSGMVEFSQRFPEQYFDVAIAEQHAVAFAAGLACEGLRPVVAIYSTFLQRGYDQLIHDVALQRLPVLFAIDRAGLVGGDGATHNGNFDLSFLRCVPNLTVMAPADENECRQMLHTGSVLDGAVAVRYPRGSGPGAKIEAKLTALPVGRAELRRRGGSGLLLLSFGTMLAAALSAGDALDATVVNMRFVKPLDEALLRALVATHAAIVTLEENVVAGGAGSGVAEFLDASGLAQPRLHVGLPDQFIGHGTREECLAEAGLDAASVQATIERWWRPLLAGLNSARGGAKLVAGGRAGPGEFR
ncbi:MAG TPA: 1-deoxy-D-xylulose-5-phosphate synthase [Steroidobacteraceae bacterium]